MGLLLSPKPLDPNLRLRCLYFSGRRVRLVRLFCIAERDLVVVESYFLSDGGIVELVVRKFGWRCAGH